MHNIDFAEVSKYLLIFARYNRFENNFVRASKFLGKNQV